MGSMCVNNSTLDNYSTNYSYPVVDKGEKGVHKKTESIASGILDESISIKDINNNINFLSRMDLTDNTSSNGLDKKINYLIGHIKGYLFRKKYKDYLKLDLMDYANEIYFQYLTKVKNRDVNAILNSTEQKMIEYLRKDWSEFYEDNPIKNILQKINSKNKYNNGLLFKYKTKSFQADEIEPCLTNALSCYKGSIDIFSNKKCGIGELIYNDGSQKMGTFYNNQFIGWNTYITKEGVIYIGLYKNNKLNGKGLIYNRKKNITYKGDFINNLKSGYGIYKTNHSEYEGEFKMNKKNGKGKLILKNGGIYEGEFKDGKFNGFGRYIWTKKNNEYIGHFLNGKFHGEGFYKWGNYNYFKGNYVHGVKEGKGEFGLRNGKKCVVTFYKGKPVGKGILIDEENNTQEEIYF